MSPCVYHMSSLTKAVTLPVHNNVITQAVLFEGDRVSDPLSAGYLISSYGAFLVVSYGQ